MTRLAARVTVFLLALTLGFGAMAGSALASCRPNPGQAASGWLARQMVDRSHFTVTFSGVTYPDQGLTIDAIYAFAATSLASSTLAVAPA